MSGRTDTYVLNFNRCNQRCLFCMKEKDNQDKVRLNYRSIIRELKFAKKAGYENVDFFGGEPTCFDFLKKAVKFSNKIGMNASLATNASKFSSIIYTNGFFHGVKIDSVRTTLHHHISKIHDEVTQTSGSFKKTIKGIKNILKYNKNLTVNIVITSLNYKDMDLMSKFIYGLGVRKIKFSGLVFSGEVEENYWLFVDSKIYLPYLSKAIRRCKKLGFFSISLEKFPDVVRILFPQDGILDHVNELSPNLNMTDYLNLL